MTKPQTLVEIAFTTDLYATPVWDDVSDYVLAIPSIRRGRQNETGRFEAGTADVVLDNADGRFTPGNSLSPWANSLKPMKRVRISATYNAITYRLFTGYIEQWPPEWAGGIQGETTLRCVDGFKLFAQARSTYSWGAESSHWRISGLLDNLGWPSGDREIYTSGADIRSGQSLVAAVSLTQNPPLSHMQDVALAEDGQLFIKGDGRVCFQGRYWRLGYTTSTDVQALFGDEVDTIIGWVLGDAALGILGATTVLRGASWVSGTASELPYLQLTMSFDDTFIVNDAQFTPTGGVMQQSQDTGSQARYGLRSRAQTLILTSNAEAADRATWTVARNSEPDIRVLSLLTSGMRDNTNLWPQVLGREISDRIAVVVRPPGALSYPIRREYWIEAVEHTNITGDDWQTSFSLSPAIGSAGSGGAFWRLEDPSYGALDSVNRIIY